MSYKEVLHDSIDIFFRETVEGVMRDNFGNDWLEKELLPQMRTYLQYGEDPKVAQKYEDFLKRRKAFEFVDATLCSAILIYDSKYSFLLKKEVVENHLKKVVWFRNQCAHNGGKDISYDLFTKGIAKLKETILMFPMEYYSVDLLNGVGISYEKSSNNESRYTHSYAWGDEESDYRKREPGVCDNNIVSNQDNRERESIRIPFLILLILSLVLFICGIVLTVRAANVVTKAEIWKFMCVFAITYLTVLLPWGYAKCGGGFYGWIFGLICAVAIAAGLGVVSVVLVFVFSVPGTIIGRILDFFAQEYLWQKFLGNNLPVLLCYGLFIVFSVRRLENEDEELYDCLFEVRQADNKEEKKRKTKKAGTSKPERNKRQYSQEGKKEEKIEKRVLISCEVCRQTLRVPVMKNRIIARCPKCNKEFMVKKGRVIKSKMLT